MRSWISIELKARCRSMYKRSVTLVDTSMSFLVMNSTFPFRHCVSQFNIILFLRIILIDDHSVAKKINIVDEMSEDQRFSRQSVICFVALFVISFFDISMCAEIQWTLTSISLHRRRFILIINIRSISWFDYMFDSEKDVIAVWLSVKMIREILCSRYCAAMKVINTRSCSSTA